MTRHPKLTAAALAAGAALAAPVLAGAVTWPAFGGDPGHSGNQPVNPADVPMSFVRELDDDGALRTGLVLTGGTAEQRAVAYGRLVGAGGAANDAARIHIRSVASGDELVSAAQQVIDDNTGTADDDTLGDGNEFITPVAATSAQAAGQLYVLHNDNNSASAVADECELPSSSSSNDIAIAQFDLATGEQKRDVAIGPPRAGFPSPELCAANPQPTDGYSLDSSPVLTPPVNDAGRRYLFAVLRKDTAGDGRLLRIRIDNAESPDAVVHSVDPAFRDVPGLNGNASPTIAYFTDPDRETVIPYVVVSVDGAGATDIRAFKVEDLSPAQIDLESPADVPGTAQTPSVPVDDDGTLPGQGDGGKAPAIYAAFDNGDGTTTVRKFVQEGATETLRMLGAADGVSAAVLPGSPSVGVALSEVVSDGEVVEGRVVVTTGQNVYALDSETLNVVDRLRDDGETPIAFGRNTPIVSGDLVFAQSDSGALYTLDLTGGLERVDQSDFVEPDANNTSTSSLGHPAYAEGDLFFQSNLGVWQFDTAIVQPPNKLPVASFSITPNPAREGQTVTFDASASSDPDGSIARYEWDLDGNGVYETDAGTQKSFQTRAAAPGTFKIGLRVTDNRGGTSTVSKDLVVGANQPPVAVFTTTPAFGTAGSPVEFDASASRDPDGSIARHQWDLDGDGTFETDTGANPKTSRTYTEPGVFNVKLRVTDSEGASAEVVRQLSVAAAERRRPGLSRSVTPKRDRTLPYRFTTKGRVKPPSGVARGDACTGRVTVTVKARKRTISRRSTGVARDCRFRTRVTFSNTKRIGTVKRLRFIVRFQGNKVLKPRSAKALKRRIG